ncbi:MAG: hypothetical protein JWQ35_1459 [Bacteriovoracaceae bacterium]|nr:hypothetical protein [Bacteriovoracaceae bacterium]
MNVPHSPSFKEAEARLWSLKTRPGLSHYQNELFTLEQSMPDGKLPVPYLQVLISFIEKRPRENFEISQAALDLLKNYFIRGQLNYELKASFLKSLRFVLNDQKNHLLRWDVRQVVHIIKPIQFSSPLYHLLKRCLIKASAIHD